MRIASVGCTTFVVLAILAQQTACELIQLHTLTRHGNRAPNTELADYCPRILHDDAAIKQTFGVYPQMLTDVGLSSMRDMGSMIRQQYVSKSRFLSGKFNDDAHRVAFRSRGQPRHLQSMSALGDGMYPSGSGPTTYPHRAQPLPISSVPIHMDSLLHIPRACRGRFDAERGVWTRTTGNEILRTSKQLINDVENMCGTQIASQSNSRPPFPTDKMKDIADMLTFLLWDGKPVPTSLPGAGKAAKEIVDLSFKMFMSR